MLLNICSSLQAQCSAIRGGNSDRAWVLRRMIKLSVHRFCSVIKMIWVRIRHVHIRYIRLIQEDREDHMSQVLALENQDGSRFRQMGFQNSSSPCVLRTLRSGRAQFTLCQPHVGFIDGGGFGSWICSETWRLEFSTRSGGQRWFAHSTFYAGTVLVARAFGRETVFGI